MPSARTYQAIGFVTYHLHMRRHREALRRAGLAAALVGALVALVAIAVRQDQDRRLP